MHYRTSTLSLRQRLEDCTIAGYDDGKAVTLGQLLVNVAKANPDAATALGDALDKYIPVFPHLKDSVPSETRTQFISALTHAAEIYDSTCHHVLADQAKSRIDDALAGIYADRLRTGRSVA